MFDTIRVLLVDDSETFLCHTSRFLERQAGIAVVGMTTSPEESLALAAELRPNVVVTDLSMPGMSGIELIPRLREQLPDARIVVLTWNELKPHRAAALAAGANDYVRKDNIIHALPAAIRRDAIRDDVA